MSDIVTAWFIEPLPMDGEPLLYKRASALSIESSLEDARRVQGFMTCKSRIIGPVEIDLSVKETTMEGKDDDLHDTE